MAFHNVPPNGFPDLPDMEEVEAVVKDVTNLKTSVAELESGLTNGLVFEPQTAPNTSNPFGDDGSGYILTIKYHGVTLGYLVIRPKNYSSPSNYPNAIELYNASWEDIWAIQRQSS